MNHKPTNPGKRPMNLRNRIIAVLIALFALSIPVMAIQAAACSVGVSHTPKPTYSPMHTPRPTHTPKPTTTPVTPTAAPTPTATPSPSATPSPLPTVCPLTAQACGVATPAPTLNVLPPASTATPIGAVSALDQAPIAPGSPASAPVPNTGADVLGGVLLTILGLALVALAGLARGASTP